MLKLLRGGDFGFEVRYYRIQAKPVRDLVSYKKSKKHYFIVLKFIVLQIVTVTTQLRSQSSVSEVTDIKIFCKEKSETCETFLFEKANTDEIQQSVKPEVKR